MAFSSLLVKLDSFLLPISKRFNEFFRKVLIFSLSFLIVHPLVSLYTNEDTNGIFDYLFSFYTNQKRLEIIIIFSGIVVVFFLIKVGLNSYAKSRSSLSRFDDFFDKISTLPPDLKSQINLPRGPIIGENITLLHHPEFTRGWSMEEVKITSSNQEFTFENPELNTKYQEYVEGGFTYSDGIKFTLKNIPSVHSDAPILQIGLIKTKFSRIRHFRKNLLSSDLNLKKEFFDKIWNQKIVPQPHSFNLHATIILDDDKVLFTKRSNDLIHYPGVWSVSAEESMSEKDLPSPSSSNIGLNWIHRFLSEEFGISKTLKVGDQEFSVYDDDDIRLMSLFLESQVFNIVACGIIRLRINEKTFRSHINSIRSDYEMSKFKLIKLSELKKVFKDPQIFGDLHPTSLYRIFFTMLFHYQDIEVFVKNT